MDDRQTIAVVGMAGLFPGASDLNAFWHNIIHKFDAAGDVPAHRWIAGPERMVNPHPEPDKALSRRCCLIRDFVFDPTGFKIPQDTLAALDPLYHLILHTARAAVSQPAGPRLDKERTGVALAAIALPTDSSSTITRELFGSLFEETLYGRSVPKPPSQNQSIAARVTSLPAAIVAEGLGLGGGTFTLDAACASSIYAVKLACDELQSQRADAMLAGGISRPECLYTQVGFSQLQALSPTGRCAPFDRSADGLVVGEGAGVLVLKRLTDALKAKDTVYGLIRGIGLSNDMRGNLLAPDSEGQVRAMKIAYDQAGWSPQDVDLVECHGAGTPVGDATELHSLTKLWGKSGWDAGQCAIGSVKSMIGHLLTGAGAAGMIKTLLALNHKMLPPSLHFEKPPANSPLIDSPFRVQTETEKWISRDAQIPRRAAVSAFGFGGINGHLLFEEWDSGSPYPSGRSAAVHSTRSAGRTINTISDPDIKPPATVEQKNMPIAVVGMEAAFGSIDSLREFQKTIFNGHSVITECSANRRKGGRISASHPEEMAVKGGFMDALLVDVGDFHIPPKEIPDILPQHLLMLKVATGAMADAGLPLREYRPRMSVIVGLEFDVEATNFHFRWSLSDLVQEWKNKYHPNLTQDDTEIWLSELQNTAGPPLTSSRTLGALGGIVASRIAREFRFGGPSFIVSAEEASGLKALEIGIRSIQQNEADAVLVGAIDFCGDVRRIITAGAFVAYSKTGTIRPFDRDADGTLPGDGATAVVLKPYEKAVADGNRIYAVIKGIGNASGGGIASGGVSAGTYTRALAHAFHEADVSPSTIGLVETHGSGIPARDHMECLELHGFFKDSRVRPAIGATKPNIGHTGAAAGLAAVVKTCLCLFQEIIPPVANYAAPADSLWHQEMFHIPAFPQYWLRDRQDGPRRACVCTMSSDGNSAAVILEGVEQAAGGKTADAVINERRRPLGSMSSGLFVVEADEKRILLEGLDALAKHSQQAGKQGLSVEMAARSWYREYPTDSEKKYAVALIGADIEEIDFRIAEARNAVTTDTPHKLNGRGGVGFTPSPDGGGGRTAFVYPGSGNHYVGMGREIGIHWPEILREMDTDTLRLKAQILPECFVPQRVEWRSGWRADAHSRLISDPLNMIFGQVVHGEVMTRLVRQFGIEPDCIIGYSLGESAGLFATKTWPDRNEMLERMQQTDLFQTELAGPCNALRQAWDVPSGEDFNWRVAVVNRSADTVRKVIRNLSQTRLLIVNTPEESVIGGVREQVDIAVDRLGCEAFFLEGVVTVHCDAAAPAADAYKALHVFPTTPPEGLRFYSCASAASYVPTSESAAASILNQALHGFDFTQTIEQAYTDGVRVFLEMGPGTSCRRMIDRILGDRPHVTASAGMRNEDGFVTIVKLLGTLITERLPVDLNRLYGSEAFPQPVGEILRQTDSQKQIRIPISGTVMSPALPRESIQVPRSGVQDKKSGVGFQISSPQANQFQPPDTGGIPSGDQYGALIRKMTESMGATADAHKTFLEFSEKMSRTYGETIALQERLIKSLRSENLPTGNELESESELPADAADRDAYIPDASARVAFTRDQCLEFATGKLANVLGPDFAPVDTYRTRVRLPDEPLMLVDRILTVEGEKKSLTSGRVVTEHDVLPDAWYLDGNRTPVSIAVEAGQADLFLCAYLGIDLAVKGERTYRLLDASVVFHRDLPQSGDVIRYEIEIEKFIRQGDTWLFFFSFEGFIGRQRLISMTDGCAGFFTEEEIHRSGGIIRSEEDTRPQAGGKDPAWKDLVPLRNESYDEAALNALRAGNLSDCFGPAFEGVDIVDSLRLPDGRMKLIDRVVNLDPGGGRFGLGIIRAEADIHPDAWFLTCHFVDDMTMPGTLMYECCSHALRVFLQRIGWVTSKPDVCYQPVEGVKSVLKCRGPVTPQTRRVIYEVEIKDIGYGPEPYVVADAHMYADGDYIVRFTDMAMKITGLTRKDLEEFWRKKAAGTAADIYQKQQTVLFDRDKILAFAVGKPSDAFGALYRAFDKDRFIARLPGPPYSFIDRITNAEPEARVLKPDGWIEAAYDVRPDAWYFRANRTDAMPLSVLLEIGLQACGWLAAYAGSALKSEKDLKFRNLDGRATQYRDILPDAGTLTVRSRMLKVSQAGDIIIEEFDFQIFQHEQRVYEGTSSFGFFTPEALAQQKGIQDEKDMLRYVPAQRELSAAESTIFDDRAPLTPDDLHAESGTSLAMPAKAIRMIDRIDLYLPEGGPHGLGFVRGVKNVDPQEWFFKAHFFQDPVCPGSLGIESFLQLLKYAAIKRWEHLRNSHRFYHVMEAPHVWKYRGQILPQNSKIEVEAVITAVSDEPHPEIRADGLLMVDGLCIYRMENYGIRLEPK